MSEAATCLFVWCAQPHCWVQHFLLDIGECQAQCDAILCVGNGTLCPVEEDSNAVAYIPTAAGFKLSAPNTSQPCL